jgi:hypothetical protein
MKAKHSLILRAGGGEFRNTQLLSTVWRASKVTDHQYTLGIRHYRIAL